MNQRSTGLRVTKALTGFLNREIMPAVDCWGRLPRRIKIV